MLRLVRYDLLMLWKGARAAFSSKRDLLLLLVGVPIILLVFQGKVSEAAGVLGQLPQAVTWLLGAATAFIVHSAVAGRLEHLQGESIVAKLALQRAASAIHAVFWHMLPLAWALLLAEGQAAPIHSSVRIAAMALAYAGGVFAAMLWQRITQRISILWGRWRGATSSRGDSLIGETRDARIQQLIGRRAGPFAAPIWVNALFLGASGILVVLLHAWTPGLLGGVLGFALLLLLLSLLLRQHPPLIPYLIFLGVDPTRTLLTPLALAALFIGTLILTLALTGAAPLPESAAAGSAGLFLFASLFLLRTLHFSIRSPKAANLMIQVDLAAILLVGFFVPPLGIFLLLLRLAMLRHRMLAQRYLAP